MKRRNFLLGLVSSIQLISTIKYGEKAGVLDLVPSSDKFRELLIRSSAVKDAYHAYKDILQTEHTSVPKLYEQKLDAFFDHIHNEFDSSVPQYELKKGQDIISNNKMLYTSELEGMSESWHPVTALRELLTTRNVNIPLEYLRNGIRWERFINKYSKHVIG